MSYGISLEFTPTLVGNNRINLHVKPEVSQLSSIGEITVSNLTAPAFTTRKAETTVELASGQSFAIAGLLDNNQDQTINKFPFLGDVPILGALFRSTNFQNDQSELVIVVTPYVVKPGSSEQAMALPMDNYSPPSDEERLLELRSGSGDPNARRMSGSPLAVPVPPSPAVAAPRADAAPNPAISSPTQDMPVSIETAPLAPIRTTNNFTTGYQQQVTARDQTHPKNELPPPAAAPVSPVVTPVAAHSATPSGPSGFILE
jgi:pilus assembly protein CpaC